MTWHALWRFGVAMAREVWWRAIVPGGMVLAVVLLGIWEAAR